MTDDARLEDTRHPPDPGICPWCGKEWGSDEDDLPTCCPVGRRYTEPERTQP